MATVSNQPENTASLNNQQFGSNDMTWDEATFTWNEATGTWDNPYAINNQAAHTASMTNQAEH